MDQNNPVVVQAASVTGFIVAIKALIAYFRIMGWLDWDEDRYQATVQLIDTVLPIAAVWIGVLWARRKVTPLTNPKDVDGTELTRPDNTPAIPQMAKEQKEALEINKKLDERRIER